MDDDTQISDSFPSDTQSSDTPTPRMFSWARNSTIYRVEKRMHTEKQLFDAIARKARQKFENISEAQVKALAESAVKFAYDNKALDDSAFAEISTRSGIRSGRSKRAIAQKLAQKGVARDTVETATADADDLYAAVVLARKRAFGPFRKVEPDEARRAKEFSAFARGGFGFEIGKRVLAMSIEEAEEVLDAGRGI
ncbi:recombination regulator RecX [Neorhizobium alkalisoli]|uniref:Regulatory protein RecX n=1 Tax=Neorhizobium alkalisoli TaxID=528178 RepID=A0A561QWT0_9HYPH|nr:recombination regulator RecX [Neorhizobium alkalisoli]TWF54816.1 regulatory protein [Neorhizobium alkalisoli]